MCLPQALETPNLLGMAKIVIKSADQDETTVIVTPGAAATIGRAEANEVPVWHGSLSRKHARITFEGEEALIEDLGSRNGTFVGRDERRLPAGERFRLGATEALRCGDVTMTFFRDDQATDSDFRPTLMTGATRLSHSLEELLSRPGAGATTALRASGDTDEDRLRNKLEILLQVSQLLSSPRPVEEVLVQILELAFQILDIDRAILLLVEDGVVSPRVSRDRKGGRVPDQALSLSVVRHVIDANEAALFADAQTDARLEQAESVMAFAIAGAMCAPLTPPRLSPIGALYVDTLTPPTRFDEQDLEFLLAFANLAAVAIHNAKLSEKLAHEAVARHALLRFFPQAAAETIMSGGLSLEPKLAEATALFCDISGWTALCSKLGPLETIELLNIYFPIMSKVVFRHAGTLEKYIGDAMLAVWGVPIETANAARDAVAAAVDMQRAMHELNERWLAGDGDGPAREPLDIHIGINSGIVAAGNIGSADYLQYATIGDATNVAARICGVANDGEIVVDEATRRRMGDHTFDLEPLPLTEVKGKSEPLLLYRVRWRGGA